MLLQMSYLLLCFCFIGINIYFCLAKGSDPRPKPRPRPAPRPKNKLLDLNQPARGPPAPPRRVSLAETMEGRPLPPISHSPDSRSNVAKKMANRPPLPAPLLDDIKHIRKYEEDTQEEDFYDEPETQLRSGTVT